MSCLMVDVGWVLYFIHVKFDIMTRQVGIMTHDISGGNFDMSGLYHKMSGGYLC